MNDHVLLDKRKIGFNCPVFIIAEIGVNHNGDYDTAIKMIDSAVECGVDCVKFQTFKAEEFISDYEMMYEYEVNGKKIKENTFQMFKRLELPFDWHKKLFDYSIKKGIIPLTSVADIENVDMVEKIGIEAFKLSSEDLINLPLVEYVIKKNKPLFLSTGMADEEEINDVLELLKKYNFENVIFLHCVSSYPTMDNEANLYRIKALKEKVKGPVGYSDHTEGIEAILGAVSLGSCIIEKHFTLDKKMDGPDHSFSSNPEELKAIVKGIRKIEKMLGKKFLNPTKTELQMRNQFRRSIVASRNLLSGHIIKREDLVLKRPGNGLRARDINSLIGKRVLKKLNKDEQISIEILES